MSVPEPRIPGLFWQVLPLDDAGGDVKVVLPLSTRVGFPQAIIGDSTTPVKRGPRESGKRVRRKRGCRCRALLRIKLQQREETCPYVNTFSGHYGKRTMGFPWRCAGTAHEVMQ